MMTVTVLNGKCSYDIRVHWPVGLSGITGDTVQRILKSVPLYPVALVTISSHLL